MKLKLLLLIIGMVFVKQNKKDEAKATFTQLLQQYPRKYEVELAKKQLKKL